MSNEYMLDAMDQFKTYADTNLATHISAVEAARSVTVDAVKAITTHLNQDEQVPFIEVMPDSTDPEYGSGESSYAEEHWNYHTLSVLVSHAGYVPAEVQNQLLYLVEAIERMVKADFTFGGLFNRVRLVRTNYALLISAQEDGRIRHTIEQFVEIRAFSS